MKSEQVWKQGRALLVTLLGLALLLGCSSSRVATTAEGQSFLQRERASSVLSVPERSVSADSAPIVEPLVPLVEMPSTDREMAGNLSSPLPQGAIEDVYFDFDQFGLRNEVRETLDQDARWLKSRDGVKVLIEGHCDERGTSAYNLVSGERRAQTVKRYLQELGVPSSQLQILSYGKERPFCAEHREACWQRTAAGISL